MSVLSGVLAKLRTRGSPAKETAAEPAAPAHVAPRPAPAAKPASTPDLDQIAAEARYHRDRLALYRARMHGAVEGTSLSRLRELQRAADAADARLRHAEAAVADRPTAAAYPSGGRPASKPMR